MKSYLGLGKATLDKKKKKMREVGVQCVLLSGEQQESILGPIKLETEGTVCVLG